MFPFVTLLSMSLPSLLIIDYTYIQADPWCYAAISIDCVACNCGDLINDHGMSKKPEKHA